MDYHQVQRVERVHQVVEVSMIIFLSQQQERQQMAMYRKYSNQVSNTREGEEDFALSLSLLSSLMIDIEKTNEFLSTIRSNLLVYRET